MPRQLTIPCPEMGSTLDLYLIYNYDGIWEEEWRPLQGAMDLPEVAKEVMDHALQGWTRPLVEALGPPPKGKLHKLPEVSRRCAHESACTFYEVRRCGVLLSKMPWCFEPGGVTPGNLAAQVIQLWRQEVYVVVVREFNG